MTSDGKTIGTEYNGGVGHRHGLMLLAFSACLFMYAARVGLSVAMVAMTSPVTGSQISHRTAVNNSGSHLGMCPVGEVTNLDQGPSTANYTRNISPSRRHYNWTTEIQGVLHGSFFYGYLITQVSGGWLSHKIGAKIPIMISMICVGFLTIVSPFAADGGVWVFFFVRFLVGCCQGVIYPSITVLWSEWAPPTERGRLLSFSYSGLQIGTVVGMSMGGYLAQTFGWESIFYCFGTFCLIWAVPWWFLAFDSPEKHPRISMEERQYIYATIHPESKTANLPERHTTPWVEIFKTVPVWALLIVEFGHCWGFYTLITNLPTYLTTVLHFSLKSSGTLSALPYLLRFLLTTSVIFVADWMRGRDFFSPTVLTKIFSIGSFVGAGSALIGVAFAGCNSTLAIIMFTTAVVLSGCIFVGHFLNYPEMSPNYVGILLGMGNTVGTISGILAPLVVGILTSGEGGQSVGNWQTVFFISTGLYAFISVIYAVFGSAVRQPWDSYKRIHPACADAGNF